MGSKREASDLRDQGAERWQFRMLPAMRGALVLMAAFFFVASMLQYRQLYEDVRQQNTTTKNLLETMEKGLPANELARSEYIRWKTMVSLEQDVMRMRYQQVNSILLLRTWTRYTGFLVGMVLALVGAFFILGRLREEASQLSGESSGIKVTLVTSSPGIVLAVLGTVLMLVTLMVKTDFEVHDRPVYLQNYTQERATVRSPLPAPAELPTGAAIHPSGADDIPLPPTANKP